MLLSAWQWSLSILGLSSMLLTTRKNKHGWTIGLVGQALYAGYVVVTSQWGLLIGPVVAIMISAYGLLAWTRKPKTTMVGAK